MKKLFVLVCLVSCLFVSAVPFSAFAAAASASSIQSFEPNELIKTDGTYWVWGGSQSVPTQITGLTDVAAAFPGRLIMKKDHTVWYWERSTPASASVHIEQVEQLSDITNVYATWDELLVIDAAGHVHHAPLTSGKLDPAQITLLPGIDHVAKVSSYYESYDGGGDYRYLFLKTDGTVWTSKDSFQSFEAIQHLDHVTDIEQNTALKSDGTVWSLPLEYTVREEQLGQLSAAKLDGLANIRTIGINGRSNFVIDKQARLWFWGATITGYSDGTTLHANKPILLTSIADVKDAYIVERSLIVLTADGKLNAASIELETMKANPVFTVLASDVVQIKGGGRHLIMKKADGTLWGWGVNKDAQLGNGSYEFMPDLPVPVQKPISVQLNGELVAFSNGVVTRNGQAFIPLRSIFEKLGAAVTWDEMKKIVTISRTESGKPSTTVTINFMTGEVAVNNKAIQSPTEPFGINGTSYLPLRLISESLGAKVDWMQKEEKISITMK